MNIILHLVPTQSSSIAPKTLLLAFLKTWDLNIYYIWMLRFFSIPKSKTALLPLFFTTLNPLKNLTF